MTVKLLEMTPCTTIRPNALYSLFGLTVSSAVPLPCPHAEPGSVADVELVEVSQGQFTDLCTEPPISSTDDGYWEEALYADGTTRVLWREHFEFIVSPDHARVLWRSAEDVSDEMVFTYLLNNVLSYCLLARGIEPLHATCVVIDGKAVAFLGDSGYGKSTLAAALLTRGHHILTDDSLVIQFHDSVAIALPSLPRIKLMPEGADTFLQGQRSITMNKFTDKMVFLLDKHKHVSTPARLAAVYLLPQESVDSEIAIERLSGQEAFLPIIKNTFNNSVLTPQRIKRQFAFANQLVNAVPIKRLSYQKRLDLLPAVVDAILADARKLQTT